MELILEILKSLLYGLIQGITEWLPISSTGHLILLHSVLPLNVYEDASFNIAFWNMYKIVIQVGSILAVIVLFSQRLWPFSPKKTETRKKAILRTWKMIFIGSIPLGILGVLLNDIVDSKLSTSLAVGITLIVYGLVILLIERYPRRPTIKEIRSITPGASLMTGCFQALSLIPGTSRSGAAIIGGMLAGMDRPVAAEFSFYLAVPAMLGAALFKLVRLDVQLNLSGLLVLLAGIASAFIVSLFVVRSLLTYVRTNDMRLFGYYRVVLGLIILILYMIGALPEGVVV